MINMPLLPTNAKNLGLALKNLFFFMITKYFSGVADDQSVFDMDCPTGDFEDCKQNWNYEDLPETCNSFMIISGENQVRVLMRLF